VPLFRRRGQGSADDTIPAFWAWWADEGRALAEQSLAGQLDPTSFARTMTEHVHSMGELGWDLTRGETSEHVLVLTPEADPDLRALARRAVLAAPEVDATWSFVDSRPPAADLESVVVDLGGSETVDLGRVQVSARMNDGRFDVQVHHPAFAAMTEESRQQATMLVLDAALGEIDTELWVGAIHAAEVPPLDGFGLTALRSVVQDLKSQRLDADGHPRWAMLRGETPSGPLVAMVRSPLHPLTAPHLDTYVAVSLPYSDHSDGGLPGPDSLDALRWFEERLESELGTSGQIVAHLSNDGVRTLHLYVDSTTGALSTVNQAARAWDQGRASVHDMHDPGWNAVSHLRG
jgi:hypothetical protein